MEWILFGYVQQNLVNWRGDGIERDHFDWAEDLLKVVHVLNSRQKIRLTSFHGLKDSNNINIKDSAEGMQRSINEQVHGPFPSCVSG